MSKKKKKSAPVSGRKNAGKAQAPKGKKAPWLAIGIGILCLAAVVVGICLKGCPKQEKTNAAATDTVNVTGAIYADIDIEDYGVITVKLDPQAAPETVENFVTLAKSGFYDGLTFHRIIEGFMMQGGDPNGNGTGGAEETITGEFSENGIINPLSHTRGAISMARSEDYNSASSQFFIVQQDSTFLDGQYAAFGYVTEGMEIVDAICAAAQPTDGNGTIAAEEQPVIRSITIR